MQIVDYTSLQTAVTEYLARDQDATLIARIPTFIQLGSEVQPAIIRSPDGAALDRFGRCDVERAGIHLTAGGLPVNAPDPLIERDRKALPGIQVRHADG
jgi:hypothetical protein